LIPESEVDRQFFPYSATYLSGSFFWDRRDDSFNPEKGWFLSSVAEWAFPLFKAESNYLKTYTKYQHFFPLLSRLNFSLTARLGLGRGRMPIPERFFAGGSNSFRGEPFDELGPKVPVTQVPVGGKALLLFNFELKFPLLSALKELSGVVFYDWGNVFSKRSDFSLADLQNAVGIGVRYRTPLGPLRFELGWNLDDPQRRGSPLAFITIGNVF
jgi:outer membrane protein insertion porin family